MSLFFVDKLISEARRFAANYRRTTGLVWSREEGLVKDEAWDNQARNS